ncbi:hypothetical protein JXA80_02250 [bacterium]|nr:hypothetical protein [candidate division CSSED10-310 bacterium]
MFGMEPKAEKLERQLKQWDIKVDALAEQAGKAGANHHTISGSEFNQLIAELRFKCEAANRMLTEFKAAGNGQWSLFKRDFHTRMHDIEGSYRHLVRQSGRTE